MLSKLLFKVVWEAWHDLKVTGKDWGHPDILGKRHKPITQSWLMGVLFWRGSEVLVWRILKILCLDISSQYLEQRGFFHYIYFYLAPTMLSDYRILVPVKHPTKVLFYSGECVSFTSRWKGTTISSSTRIKWKAKLQIRKITHTSLKRKNRDAVQIEQYHRIQSV